MITVVDSVWRETGIACPECGNMTYTDGKHRPVCMIVECQRQLSDEEIWQWLTMQTITSGPKQLNWKKYRDGSWYAGYGDLTYIISETGSKYRLSVQYHTSDPCYLGWFISMDDAQRRAQYDFGKQFYDMIA